jgi:hypothetical protein
MDKFEEYKLLNERAQKLSERRQITTQTYLTINTAIIGAVAFLIKDSGLQGWALLFIALSLFLVGLAACTIWLRITIQLEKILDWQYDRLREMEAEAPKSSRIFTRENEAFFEKGGRKIFSFSLQEAWLPAMLMILYGLYTTAMILAVSKGWL